MSKDEKVECLSVLSKFEYAKDSAKKLLIYIARHHDDGRPSSALALRYARKVGYDEGALYMVGLNR
jgi:hypothetical protein